ncbi:MAG: 16S rRNA (cytosine(1402)-N(4))-methyltransferase RsmH [Thiotrichaceae bacterium]|nr:16S rRNA (cytosine(1402)-N(4))-methyltransferase RsmH [Thiotrichaceae bacterium]
MNTEYSHQTVLLYEAIDALNIKANGCYIDATFGRGGHSELLLQKLGENGRLIVIDKDPEAIVVAKELQEKDARVFAWQGAFSHFDQAIVASGFTTQVDGILLDLGVSSPQLDDASRGFSFLRDGALDMRMNPDKGVSAAEWLMTAEQDEIADVIWRYGEERFSRRIARTIVAHRETHEIATTKQLADLIAGTIYQKDRKKHPATRSFQAIRIFINQELDNLTECLQKTIQYLAPEGRLAVISFHSLEDRIVKRFLKQLQQGPKLPKGLPVIVPEHKPEIKIISRVKPSRNEVGGNVRSRSAIMRVGEKT